MDQATVSKDPLSRLLGLATMEPAAVLHGGASLAALFATILFLYWQAAFIPAVVLMILAAVGSIGMVWRMRLGPALVVLFVCALQWRARDHWFGVIPGFDPPLHGGDLAMAASLWAFVVCQCRYLEIAARAGASRQAKRRWPWLGRSAPSSRPASPPLGPSGDRVYQPAVLGRSMLWLPVWPLVGLVCWRLLPTDERLAAYLSVPLPLVRVAFALWLLGGVFLLLHAWFGYARWRRRSPLEAEVALNDLVWRDLRREQEHIARACRRT